MKKTINTLLEKKGKIYILQNPLFHLSSILSGISVDIVKELQQKIEELK